ncbi:MAG: succinylglutamate desuccinylase/aspartoacylase family protein [Devosia sp.]|uniref:succinylglutamate desuccinylase/aspartoacylase family protein n=1 Tax=Devosia sp. TaxID=1871048 RepID=UPI001A414BD4|nr:succinylglutamate desuccinylase/aspartoacylase family protein [Devosia sp.]MBL8597956.1 succinylglutamate desuccinylase/aspartoacylase family protein [Devosia sp.]
MLNVPQSYTGNAFTNVDFDKQGRQLGFVSIPHSPNGDAWGVTQVPIAVIANGTGPTVVIEGGNHGDEYEGPITIGELARDLDPGAVQGRLILMPANNVHAVLAATRTSPVDGLNFNRVWPGDPMGSITEQIAAYVAHRIFPMADAFLDLHSGGSSLDILASAIIEPTDDAALHEKNVAAVQAFDAPYTVVIANMGDQRTATATACRAGLITVGTEMRGRGTVSLDALEVCRRGVRNVLAHLGVLEGAATSASRADRPILELGGAAAYVYAPIDGVFEPFHDLGEHVSAGQPAGRIHRIWDLTAGPVTVHYAADGIVYGQRHPGRVALGNCCVVVASPYGGPSR